MVIFSLFSQASSMFETILSIRAKEKEKLEQIRWTILYRGYFMVKLLNIWIKKEKNSVEFWREGNTHRLWIYDSNNAHQVIGSKGE